MQNIRFNYSKAEKFIDENEFKKVLKQVDDAKSTLTNKTGAGNDFLGWLNLPKDYSREELEKVKKTASRIRSISDVVIIIGIGGSYLGAKAGIEMLTHSFNNNLSKQKRNGPEIYFAGQNISSTYLQDLIEIIEGKDVSINVISKSGTTTEPAIAFRIFKKLLEDKYGKDGAKDRIIVTTDKERGALKKLADEEGYESFVIPDDVGGRYSVFTPVGLLPLAIAGLDVDKMMEGYKTAYDLYLEEDAEKNECYQYVAVRNALYNKGTKIEVMVNYEPKLHYFSEWWKQLYGESEGKDLKGLFPASVDFTTDLHSMGQFLQEGNRILSEIVVRVMDVDKNITIESDKYNIDGLNYLAGRTMNYVNQKACDATILAHNDGNVPVMVLEVPSLNEFYFGEMVYFFEKACGVSGYVLGVNPFNQPGVEAYKKNMFALLGKPGYEEQRKKLKM